MYIIEILILIVCNTFGDHSRRSTQLKGFQFQKEIEASFLGGGRGEETSSKS